MTEGSPPNNEAERHLRSDVTYAERLHDYSRKARGQYGEAALQSGILVQRSLLAINGGAAVAILAFVGSLANPSEGTSPEQFQALVKSLEWFGWGVALATVAGLISYFVNFFSAWSYDNLELSWDYPYLIQTKRYKRFLAASLFLSLFAFLTVVGSLAAFLLGMISFSDSVLGLQ